jgi:hypothetical protein
VKQPKKFMRIKKEAYCDHTIIILCDKCLYRVIIEDHKYASRRAEIHAKWNVISDRAPSGSLHNKRLPSSRVRIP